uniref:chemotaxis protein CheW n=1 Tax=Cyanothece sp. BG0011 TaxID=2082950 RepID=UPI000D1E08D3
MSSTNLSTKLETLLPHLFNPQTIPGEPYLRFQLTSEISGVISMEKVQETLVIPSSQITPIPNMKASFVGLINYHHSVFSVFDFAHLLNLSASYSSSQLLHLIIVRLPFKDNSTESFLGLSVQQILGLTRLSQDKVEMSTMDISKELSAI